MSLESRPETSMTVTVPVSGVGSQRLPGVVEGDGGGVCDAVPGDVGVVCVVSGGVGTPVTSEGRLAGSGSFGRRASSPNGLAWATASRMRLTASGSVPRLDG